MKRYTYHAEEKSELLWQPDRRMILNEEYFTSWGWQLTAASELDLFKSHYDRATVATTKAPLLPALTTEAGLESIRAILERRATGAFANWTLEQMLEVPGVSEQLLNFP